jgi:hypothetical protein
VLVSYENELEKLIKRLFHFSLVQGKNDFVEIKNLFDGEEKKPIVK